MLAIKILALWALAWLSVFPSLGLSWIVGLPPPYMLGHATRCLAIRTVARNSATAHRSSAAASRLFMSSGESRKPGVATPEELEVFVKSAGDRLLVVDVRNPDPTVEPGDQKSLAVAPLPSQDAGVRPQAVHLIWDRSTDSMPLPPTHDLDTPIITHCGGGGRGQKAKDFLLSKGFTNVLNGGGPKETECWKVFGEK